jgi:23S rRNA (cytosine1962-C5)-methyltransferase
MLLLTPKNFPDYELIDCGNFYKLERFGKFITIRPEPQAVWKPMMQEKEWGKMAHVRFVPTSSSSGKWEKIREMPDRWTIDYTVGGEKNTGKTIRFRLALTAFKHVGIFPEQAVNWDYIAESLGRMKTQAPRVLNLFAYTGGASLAARASGADVIHLDSVKQVVTWAHANMELSNLSDIRWIVEDAMAFVKKEVKRGKKYNGIILDPPAYGHGTDGHKWKLEEMIAEMMKYVFDLLDEDERFLILNTYSLGFSSLIVENLLGKQQGLQTGELYLHSRTGLKLPLGVFGRFCNA